MTSDYLERMEGESDPFRMREKFVAAMATVREHPEWTEANVLADELECRWNECEDWRKNNIRFMTAEGPRIRVLPCAPKAST